MPMFFMNIINDLGFTEDEVGLQLPDVDAARAAALGEIRGLIAEDILAGRSNINITIQVVNAAGELVFRLPATVTVSGLNARES